MVDYHQHAPGAPFTRRRLCTRATPDGRITLSDRKLVVTGPGGERSEVPLPDEAALRRALLSKFGIEAP